jgi:ferritin
LRLFYLEGLKMLNQNLLTALNSQYNFERFSSAVYTSLAAHLDTLNLVGMAKYLRGRAAEEESHAGKFENYIIDRNGVLVVDGLPKPEPCGESDILKCGETCFSLALDHEHNVTTRLEMLYALAESAEDPRTCVFLHWFLTEQVEEERSLEEILTRFKLATGNGAAILLLDHWFTEA